MKKTLIMLTVALMSLQSVYSQQALVESKFLDNWYVGINGGINSKITHNNDFFNNLNPHAGIRLGHYITPVIGFAAECDMFFSDHKFEYSHSKSVKAINANLLGTVNLTNCFGGYLGAPRLWELSAFGGIGALFINDCYREYGNKYLVSRWGLNVAFNLGRDCAWQIYLEPAINYNLSGDKNRVHFNLNQSALQLSVGVNYKFGNSNGTHNFKVASLRDQTEIDDLNIFINELKGEVAAKDKRIAQDIRRIADLEDSLEVAKKVKPATTIVNKVVNKVVTNNVLQPTVIFGQGKSTVDAAQMASVAMIAKYMKNHPESKILIKGYASPEGNPELNQRLSENRAQSVKNVLVNRYGIAESRLTIQGMGATDELFDEVDFNRVATFTDTTK